MPAKERLERLKKIREARKSGQRAGDNESNVSSSGLPDLYGTASSNSGVTQKVPSHSPNTNANATDGGFGTTVASSHELRGFQKSIPAPRFRKDPTPLVPAPTEANQKDLWASLARQEQYDFETKLLQERQQHEAKMAEQRQFLDKQIALREEKKAKEREAKLSERPVVDTDHLEWLAENERKREMKSMRVAAIGEERSAQIERRKQRKATELAHEKAADAAVLENIAIMNSIARQRQIEEQDRKRKMKDELIRANEALKERQAAAKEEERELERRIVEEMTKKEAEDYEKRERNFALFREKIKGREAMAMKLQLTMEQRSAEDEARAVREAEEMRQRDLAARRAAHEQRERDKQAVLEILKLQVESRRMQREEEEEAKRREKAELTELYRREVEKVREEHERDRAKLATQRDLLNAQMEERSRLHPVVVSTEEMKLNAPLIARAERDCAKHSPLPYTSPSRDSGYKNRESASRIF